MQVTRNGKPDTLIVESIRNLSLEVKFSHEHRLSELGQLSAGVAHEIYNPLTAVHLALHAFFKDFEQPDADPDEMHQYLHIVDQEIDKCINVTERLLKLSAAPASQPELVSVQTVVEETLSLLKYEAEKVGIELTMNFADKELRILATDSEMRMLILNLRTQL
jgi:signal transduction histidine kinase